MWGRDARRGLLILVSRSRGRCAGWYWESGSWCIAGLEAEVDAVLEHVLECVKSQEMKAVVRFRGSGRDRAMLEETLDATFDEQAYLGGGARSFSPPLAKKANHCLMAVTMEEVAGAKNHGTDAGEIGEVRAEVDEGGRSDIKHLGQTPYVFVWQSFQGILEL
jgi:hypothetical protein